MGNISILIRCGRAPNPCRPVARLFFLGAMGPLGIKHAAAWADGWYPVDVAMEDVSRDVQHFRDLLAQAGREQENVQINIQIMGNRSVVPVFRTRSSGRATFCSTSA